MFLVLGGIILVLAGMVYQDFRYRGIYWWLFPLLLILFIVEGALSTAFTEMIRAAGCNVFFLMVQVILLSGYISVKTGRLTNIFKGYLGLGDLLFLLSISFCFSFLNFVLFYLVSLLLVILFTLLFGKREKTKNEKIPLAGYQALLLLVVLLASHFFKGLDLRTDFSLINLPYGN